MSTAGEQSRHVSQARIRLLEVADELFYAEGILATGVDRIIAEAQVTKATLYKQYGSKDRLIMEYLTARDQQVREVLQTMQRDLVEPRAVLSAVIEAIVAETARSDFRGDPFLNAAAEYPAASHPVRMLVADHRDWLIGFVEDRFRALGHPRPGLAADEFSLLRDGALSGAYAGDAIGATAAFARAADRLIAEGAPVD